MFHASSETRKSGEGLCLCEQSQVALNVHVKRVHVKSEKKAEKRSKKKRLRIKDEQYNYQEILTLEDDYRLFGRIFICLLYTSPSPRDRTRSRMPSSA